MDLKIFANNVEQSALDQINLLTNQTGFSNSKIRIMPDVHAGKGCVIGFTATGFTQIIPNIVGVDIGCGVLTGELGKMQADLDHIDHVARTYCALPVAEFGSWCIGYEAAIEKDLRCYKHIVNKKWNSTLWARQVGTLGSGNHFIEIDKDEDGNAYLLIHSGSRNLGHTVAKYYQEKANEGFDYKATKDKEKRAVIKGIKVTGQTHLIQRALEEIDLKYETMKKVPEDLRYLDWETSQDYLHDMDFCVRFAAANRNRLAENIVTQIKLENHAISVPCFDTIHNYIEVSKYDDDGEEMTMQTIRKGAVSSKLGQKLVIPINMKDGALICVGRSNEDWNYSAPHGAGRLMGRGDASRNLNLKDFKKSMEGIYSTSVNEKTLDEAPNAYKPIEEIISQIGDTATIYKHIKPIYNFKNDAKI